MKKVVKVLLVLCMAAVAALMWRDTHAKQPLGVVYPTQPEVFSVPTPAAPAVVAEPIAPVWEARVKEQELPVVTPLPQKDKDKGVWEVVSKAEVMNPDGVDDAKAAPGKGRNK
ncbi:MAG: hypothetical protein IPM39_23450 [Chloroflexi bacterium]|nr:hypothetical protein [Chloroflexota bacterium]